MAYDMKIIRLKKPYKTYGVRDILKVTEEEAKKLARDSIADIL